MVINNGFGIRFRGLMQKDMSLLEKWYGMTENFGYATGFKDFSDIRQRLFDSTGPKRLISMIDNGEDNQTIGFVFGEIKSIEAKTVLWINILIIEPTFQRKGFGTLAINKFLHFAELYYDPLMCIVAVSDKNIRGLSFWEKAGFSHSAAMEESLNQSKSSHVSILKRVTK